MDREEKFKHLILCLFKRMQRYPEMRSVIQEILGENTLQTEAENLIAPAEELLLYFWQDHPDDSAKKVLHPLAPECSAVLADHAPEKIAETLLAIWKGYPDITWEQKFYTIWRNWQKTCPPDSCLFPADKRLTASSFFLQQELSSVLETIHQESDTPAFLLFQLGPVQEFIASARSTKDLLSGSYLIAFLAASGMKSIADEVCPGCIVFPNLHNQGVFDLQNREMLQKISCGQRNLWDEAKEDGCLLSPTIPNRFLALVPAERAKTLAQQAEEAVRRTFREIGDDCFREFCRIFTDSGMKYRKRWENQVENFLQITWQTLPLNEEFLKEAACTDNSFFHFKQVIESDFQKTFDTEIFGWSHFFEKISRYLAARRNTRDFRQIEVDLSLDMQKDSLTGKEEIIGDRKEWDKVLKGNDTVFKENEKPYGALTLIKRLWFAGGGYVQKRTGEKIPSFLSTEDLAKRNAVPHSYIAVLAMDGDNMGKWISGEKTPPFLQQLSPETRKFFTEKWKKHGWSTEERMPVTPGYHLQFSEALAVFATREARKVVEAHKGELVYAGGDDVLALLPSTEAVGCAKDLRERFCAIQNDDKCWLPGPNASVSCGIAIGHYQQPLQSLIEEARKAEHRAKNDYRRNALAISVFKRSGEILHWGTKFTSQGLPLFDAFWSAMVTGSVSSRFANALAEILAPYQLKNGELPPEAAKILEKDFEHICANQSTGEKKMSPEQLGMGMAGEYLKEILTTGEDCSGIRPQDFANLFLTCKFMLRGADERGENK